MVPVLRQLRFAQNSARTRIRTRPAMRRPFDRYGAVGCRPVGRAQVVPVLRQLRFAENCARRLSMAPFGFGLF